MHGEPGCTVCRNGVATARKWLAEHPDGEVLVGLLYFAGAPAGNGTPPPAAGQRDPDVADAAVRESGAELPVDMLTAVTLGVVDIKVPRGGIRWPTNGPAPTADQGDG